LLACLLIIADRCSNMRRRLNTWYLTVIKCKHVLGRLLLISCNNVSLGLHVQQLQRCNDDDVAMCQSSTIVKCACMTYTAHHS